MVNRLAVVQTSRAGCQCSCVILLTLYLGPAAVSCLRAVWKFPKQMRKWLTSNFRKDTSDCSQRLPNTSQTGAWGSTKGDEVWALSTSQLTLGQCVPKTPESTMCLSHPRMSRFPQLHHTRATDTFLAHTETRWSFIWRSNCKTSTSSRPKIQTSKTVTPLLCQRSRFEVGGYGQGRHSFSAHTSRLLSPSHH